ncbi:hypothetical protein Tco_1063395 [Tanacetum coccineum]
MMFDIGVLNDDDLMFDTSVLNDEEVFARQDMAEKEVSTADLLTTVGEVVTTANDKGKGIMVEEPLKMKKKDQISFDEQEAIRLQAEFDEEVRLAREKDEANVALIEEWNDIQAKIKADQLLAQRLVNTFVDMDIELMKGSKTREESSSKRAGDELEQEPSKKQKVDDDKETKELKVHYVTMQNILYYLLVEKMYSLTKHTLHHMFNDVKLQVDYECEMAFELLRLVKKQLKEGYVPQ